MEYDLPTEFATIHLANTQAYATEFLQYSALPVLCYVRKSDIVGGCRHLTCFGQSEMFQDDSC